MSLRNRHWFGVLLAIGAASSPCLSATLIQDVVEHQVLSQQPIQTKGSLQVIVGMHLTGGEKVHSAVLARTAQQQLAIHQISSSIYRGNYASDFSAGKVPSSAVLLPKLLIEVRHGPSGTSVEAALVRYKPLSQNRMGPVIVWRKEQKASSLDGTNAQSYSAAVVGGMLATKGFLSAAKGLKDHSMAATAKKVDYRLIWMDPLHRAHRFSLAGSLGGPGIWNLHAIYWGVGSSPWVMEVFAGYSNAKHRGVGTSVGVVLDNRGDWRVGALASIYFANSSSQTVDAQLDAFGRVVSQTTTQVEELTLRVGPTLLVRYKNFFSQVGVHSAVSRLNPHLVGKVGWMWEL